MKIIFATEFKSFPRKIMEQCWFCPAKFWRYSFWGKNNNKNYVKIEFSVLFSNIFLNQRYFRDLYNSKDQILNLKNSFCPSTFN